MTLTSTSLSSTQKAHLHAVIASAFCLIPRVVEVQPLADYAVGVSAFHCHFHISRYLGSSVKLLLNEIIVV